MSPAYTDPGSSLSRTRLAGEQGEVRTGAKTGFQLRNYQFDLKEARSDPHLRWWLEESNVLPGQPLHPLKHALQIFTTHNSGCLYQQRRGDEVGLPVCPAVENPVLVHQETGNSQGTSHPRTARGFPSYMLPVAPATSGPVCHQIQQQTTIVCVTGSGSPGMGSGCTQPVMAISGPICLPTSSHLGQSGGEVAGLPMQQDHSDCTRVAQHALVLGSSGNVQPDPLVSAQPAKSGVSAIQPDPAQELVKPEPTCLAPRATAIKE